MKRVYLFFIFLIQGMVSYAEFDTTYYTLINRAHIASIKGNKVEALKMYQLAFKKEKGFNTDFDDAIRLALELGERKKALKMAKLAVTKNGFQFYNSIRKCDTFKFKDSLFVKDIGLKYPKWRKAHGRIQDENTLKISYLIRGICEAEQSIRVYLHSSDSSTWKFTNAIDSINFIEFKDAVNLFGFPNISKLDQKIVQDLELLLIHFRTLSLVTKTPINEMVWLDSLMKTQLLIGNVHPTVFAYAYDRFYCLNSKINHGNELQWFGLFNSINGFTTIDGIEEVDIRRKSIFLLPLYFSAQLSKFAVPSDYRYDN